MHNACMPSLQIRNLPEDLYDRLNANAKRERRSLAQQAIVLLDRALREPEANRERWRRVVQEMKDRPLLKPGQTYTPPDVLIREDRER